MQLDKKKKRRVIVMEKKYTLPSVIEYYFLNLVLHLWAHVCISAWIHIYVRVHVCKPTYNLMELLLSVRNTLILLILVESSSFCNRL